jgi:hypothetical protein
MSGIFGGGGSKSGYDVTGGGTDAPWTWGVSPFDQSMIDAATSDNTTAVQNRYQQLGLGGSTMEGQDVSGAQQMGQAITGQEQTQNVGNPALNPALQPQLNQLIGGTSSGSGLGGLASAAGGLIGKLL